MKTQQITIPNKLGLHARAAAKLVKLAAQYSSEVFLEKDDNRINGKSIMGVMMLAASQGSIITLITDGEDEKDALQALSELIDDGFGEEQ